MGIFLTGRPSLKLAEQYGVDGIMIGRGIFTNPFAFEKEPREHSSKELLDLLRLHLDLHDEYSKEEARAYKPLLAFSRYISADSGEQVN